MTSPDAPSPAPAPAPRRLRRSAGDRRIAGVAGGVADYFGLDPTMVRIAFVLLTLVGGLGLAAYAVGAFVMPAEEGSPPMTTTAKAALGVIAVCALLSFPFAGGGLILLVVPVALAVLVWRFFGGKVDPRVVRASVVVVALAGSVLLGLGAGVAAAFGAGTFIAALVIIAGLALIAGGMRGGARWLVLPALMLAIPATVVEAADLKLKGGVGDRGYRPASVSELRPVYRLGVGELALDLRDLHIEATQVVDVRARIGVGEVQVTVPRGVCVQSAAHAGIGATDILGRVNDGVDVDAERGGIAAAGQPTIRVHLEGGIADLRVNHTPDESSYDEFDHGHRRHVDGPLHGTGCEG
jgi:phage shock protein PspC (stress-responsive transcriptional regulator)